MIHRLVLPVLVLPLAALALPVASVPASAAIPAAGPKTVVEGQLTGDAAAVGAIVEVAAWPNAAVLDALPDGARVPVQRLGSTTTDGSRSYRLAPNLAGLSARYREPDGTINLELQVRTDTRSQAFGFSAAVPGTAAAADATVAEAGDPARIDFDLRGQRVSDSKQRLSRSVSEDGEFTAVSPGFTAPRGAQSRRVVGRAEAAAVGQTWCNYTASTRYTGRPEHFVNVYSYPGAPGTLTQTQSAGHTLGMGVKVGTGGWGVSGTTSIETTTGNRSTRTFTNATAVSNKVNYRLYDGSCYSRFGQPYSRDELKPVSFYALSAAELDRPVTLPNWTACTALPRGAFAQKDRGSNVTYEGGVDLPPINLSARAGFSNDMSITFVGVAAHSRYCGSSSTGGPAGSPQAQSKPVPRGGSA